MSPTRIVPLVNPLVFLQPTWCLLPTGRYAGILYRSGKMHKDSWEATNMSGRAHGVHGRWNGEGTGVQNGLMSPAQVQRGWGSCKGGGDLTKQCETFPASFPIANTPCRLSIRKDFSCGKWQKCCHSWLSLSFQLAFPQTLRENSGNNIL